MKNVLIASDHVMLGTMGMRAMTPYLEAAGHRVAELPTGLVSNNFGYGQYALKEETAFLADSLANWQKLGFHFDALISGFLFSQEQVDIIKNYAQKEAGLYWVHDPIMGDYGGFYKGMNPQIAQWHLQMAKEADVCLPNFTEAQLLLNKKVRLDLKTAEKKDLLKALYDETGKNWVVTSVLADDNHGEIWLSDEGQIDVIAYEKLPLNMVGTGDMFASFYTLKYLKDGHMKSAATFANQAIKKLLATQKTDAGMLGIVPNRHIMDTLEEYF